MNKKKIVFFGLGIVVIVGIAIYLFMGTSIENVNSENITEYVPEQEISDEQLRETIVSLYFLNTETNELRAEGRLIDAVELIENPYKTLVKLLIDGPKSDKFKVLIPIGTEIIDATISSGCVVLNFSDKLLEYNNDEILKGNILNSIINTLTELTEVKSVKILINGEVNSNFSGEYTKIE